MNRIRAYTSKYYQDLMNVPGKINDVAAGFAIGIVVSFSPWIGLHLILIFLLCWFFKKSFAAGALSSLVFNPLSAPFIWALNYEVGKVILRAIGHAPAHVDTKVFSNPAAFWLYLKSVVYPLAVGGFFIGAPLAILSYYMVQNSLRVYRMTIYGKVGPKLKKIKHHREDQSPDAE